MPLEVRQMVVKSSVVPQERGGVDEQELERWARGVRREVLRECRKRIEAARNDRKER